MYLKFVLDVLANISFKLIIETLIIIKNKKKRHKDFFREMKKRF